MNTAPWFASDRIATLVLAAPYFAEDSVLKGARSRAGEGTSMFLVLWEFEVKPGCEDRFETIYSPGGDWDSLFRRDANHLKTQLFRDIARPRIYITIDSWESRETYNNFLAAHGAEYHEIDTICEGLTTNERHLGSFEQPAQ
jgi:hypothetical protein